MHGLGSSTLTTRLLLHELRTFKKLTAFKKLKIYIRYIQAEFWQLSGMEATKKLYIYVFLTYSYQLVKSNLFQTMYKTEERATK